MRLRVTWISKKIPGFRLLRPFFPPVIYNFRGIESGQLESKLSATLVEPGTLDFTNLYDPERSFFSKAARAPEQPAFLGEAAVGRVPRTAAFLFLKPGLSLGVCFSLSTPEVLGSCSKPPSALPQTRSSGRLYSTTLSPTLCSSPTAVTRLTRENGGSVCMTSVT